MWNALIGCFGDVTPGLNCGPLARNNDLVIRWRTDNSPCRRRCRRAGLACRSAGYAGRRRARGANRLRDTEEIVRARQRLVHG